MTSGIGVAGGPSGQNSNSGTGVAIGAGVGGGIVFLALVLLLLLFLRKRISDHQNYKFSRTGSSTVLIGNAAFSKFNPDKQSPGGNDEIWKFGKISIELLLNYRRQCGSSYVVIDGH